MVSPTGGGPFHTSVWRIGQVVQLVEGGGKPYWLSLDNGKSDGLKSLPFDDSDDFDWASDEVRWIAVTGLLLMIAAQYASSGLHKQLRREGIVLDGGGVLHFSSQWQVSEELAREVAQDCSHVQLAILPMSYQSLLDEAAMDTLSDLGFSLEMVADQGPFTPGGRSLLARS